MSDGASFGTVAIVGVGLLGGSIGKALQRNNSAQRIIGVGRSPERLALALELGAVTEVTDSLDDAVAVSDVIILCTPVNQIIADLPLTLLSARSTAVITDVGSVKSPICQAAGSDPRFVGGHPMAGSEQAGVVPSRADLFQEATWAITPTEATDPNTIEIIKRLAQNLGAATLILPPGDHDRAVGITSHLPHAIATSLMRLAADRNKSNPEIRHLTAGSFADATRVAASSADLWRDIFHYNQTVLIEILEAYQIEIAGFIEDLKAEDKEKLHNRFVTGSDAKRSWSEQG